MLIQKGMPVEFTKKLVLSCLTILCCSDSPHFLLSLRVRVYDDLVVGMEMEMAVIGSDER
jgi:hypothetical protein